MVTGFFKWNKFIPSRATPKRDKYNPNFSFMILPSLKLPEKMDRKRPGECIKRLHWRHEGNKWCYQKQAQLQWIPLLTNLIETIKFQILVFKAPIPPKTTFTSNKAKSSKSRASCDWWSISKLNDQFDIHTVTWSIASNKKSLFFSCLLIIDCNGLLSFKMKFCQILFVN